MYHATLQMLKTEVLMRSFKDIIKRCSLLYKTMRWVKYTNAGWLLTVLGALAFPVTLLQLFFPDAELLQKGMATLLSFVGMGILALIVKVKMSRKKVAIIASAHYDNIFLKDLLLNMTSLGLQRHMDVLLTLSDGEADATFDDNVRSLINDHNPTYIVYIPWSIPPSMKHRVDKLVDASSSIVYVLGDQHDCTFKNRARRTFVHFNETRALGSLKAHLETLRQHYDILYLPKEDNRSNVSEMRRTALAVEGAIDCQTEFPRGNAFLAVRDYVRTRTRPTVFICANGEFALGCDDALQLSGPCDEDIVLSFDEIPEIVARYNSIGSCIKFHFRHNPTMLAAKVINLIERDIHGDGAYPVESILAAPR